MRCRASSSLTRAASPSPVRQILPSLVAWSDMLLIRVTPIATRFSVTCHRQALAMAGPCELLLSLPQASSTYVPDVCGRPSKVILRVVAAVDLGDVLGRAVVPFPEEVAWTAAARAAEAVRTPTL